MPELIRLFQDLSAYFDRVVKWEDIEEIYDQISEAKAKKANAESHNKRKRTRPDEENSDDDSGAEEEDEPTEASTTAKCITDLPVVLRALNDEQVLSTLLELCATIRNRRGEPSASYDNRYDAWDQVVKVAPRDAYLAFIYALAGLSSLDEASATYIKLSLAAVNLYFLSLTIPGAKGFHIFEKDVISHCLQVFTLVERIQNDGVLKRMKMSPSEIWVRFASFCDDLKLLLRYVHFNDHKETRDALLRKLVAIQYLNHERGYATNYAANMHSKCFEIFEEFINAHNGEPEETLNKILNMTVHLHSYPPKPKSSGGFSAGESEHISDFFIKCINKYPALLVKVLSYYINCVITNPIKTWKTEQTQRAIDYAAKYDAVLFTKCNASCVEDFLCDAFYADEVAIRTRAIELATRILQIESQVDWQMFRHEISNIPREVFLIKELVDSLRDVNNTVKMKAVQGLHAALLKGSPNTRKIIIEGLKYAQYNDENVQLPIEPRVGKNEIRFGKPEALAPEYTFNGHGLIEMAFLNLPEYIYTNLFQCTLSHIRRAGIVFMEEIIKLNPLIIFNTNFVTATSSLVDEPTALVRKQTLHMIDTILEAYPNCYPVIWAWCTIVSPMMRDPDPKNIELAMNCFRSRVLLNIKGIDQSNKAEHFMPWVIIRTMLSTQPRLYLQTCFHLALQERMINTSILSIIESHLLTSNSTEAWIVLNFISGKVMSKEPDSLIYLFTSMDSWNKEQNMLIALEVLATCIKDFSHTALNNAFTHIHNGIRDGRMLPVLIGKAFDFLLLIDNRSQTQNKRSDYNQPQEPRCAEDGWITELHQHLEYCILNGIADFPGNRATFMSHLYSYSEVNLQTRLRPDQQIVAFVQKYMSVCTALPESDLDLDNERLFNSMILIAGRLSLRDSCVARSTCALYGAILRKIDRPPIVNTIIVSLTDLCKKHTQLVEGIIQHVLRKLSSSFVVNRVETFRCFERLVLQDQLKLRGSLLLALLAVVLDEDAELATYASNFFAEALSKNALLFKQCLVACPFTLNEYKNLDGLDTITDGAVKSPLKGDSKRRHRHALYNHLMAKLDDITLVAHFGQLKLIKEKSERDAHIITPEGMALVTDVLYILRRVCQLVKKQKGGEKDKNEQESQEEDVAAENNDLMDVPEASTSKQAAEKAAAGAGKGANPRFGRRARDTTTMADALKILEKSLVFIPTIYEHVHDYDDSAAQYFDDLGRALNKRFPQMIQYAQPTSFWSKYYSSEICISASAQAGPDEAGNADAVRARQTATVDSSDSDSDEDSMPLAVLQAKRKRPTDTELPMECLFNPNK